MQIKSVPKSNHNKGSVFLSFATIIIIVLALVSCKQKTVFEKNNAIESVGWHYENEWVFTLHIEDTTQLHDMYINVRNNTDYPYSNLLLFFTTEFPDGRLFKDTVECILAERTGEWTGSGFGSIKSNSFHFRKDVWFPIKGEHTFTIKHAMREEYLKGITDIGLRIDRKMN